MKTKLLLLLLPLAAGSLLLASCAGVSVGSGGDDGSDERARDEQARNDEFNRQMQQQTQDMINTQNMINNQNMVDQINAAAAAQMNQ